jgi:hypothetical protein
VNTASATRHLSIRTAAQFASPGAGTLEVRFRGTRRVFDLSETPSNIVLDLNVPHGTTTISFHSGQPGIATGVPGQQPVAFRLNNVWFDAPFVSATRTNGNPT